MCRQLGFPWIFWIFYLLYHLLWTAFNIGPALYRKMLMISRHFPFLPSPSSANSEILDQADALRKKRAEADAKAERILPALFIKMFGDPAMNPKGWEKGQLSSVLMRHR